MRVRSTDNLDDLRPLLAQWSEKLNGDYFGFDVTLDKGMVDLDWWAETFQHALFLAEDDDGRAIGLMAVFAVQNHMATKPIAIRSTGSAPAACSYTTQLKRGPLRMAADTSLPARRTWPVAGMTGSPRCVRSSA